MSSIGSTPPGLPPTGFDPAGRIPFDEVRQQELPRTDAGTDAADARPAAPVDQGETVLGLSAWGDADATRLLPRDDALTGQLSQMARGDAADAGVDSILAAL